MGHGRMALHFLLRKPSPAPTAMTAAGGPHHFARYATVLPMGLATTATTPAAHFPLVLAAFLIFWSIWAQMFRATPGGKASRHTGGAATAARTSATCACGGM